MKKKYFKIIHLILAFIIISFVSPRLDLKTDVLAKTSHKQKKPKHIIKTKKELIKSMRLHVERLDKNFSFYIDKKVMNINNKKQYDAFWNSLYEIPEFNDISRYFKNFNAFQTEYKTYYKWTIKTGYSITKKELRHLNKFIVSWVAKNISADMTDEEKVRAINDFMVAEYRYTFGDKGPCQTQNCPEEKLGKYSVYSTFSLIYGKGGVCDAKAKLFYRLAKKSGLEVLYITGYVNKTTLHAWNMVKVDGEWYHVDNTWNRSTEPGMNEYQYIMVRDYYLKGDASMKKGHHSWKSSKYPTAPNDYPLKNIK